MKTTPKGFRVVVLGASTLLGKELLNVLEERGFPIARLITFEDEVDEDSPLPIVDLQESSHVAVSDADLQQTDVDIVFVAGPPPATAPEFLSHASLASSTLFRIVDLTGTFQDSPGRVLTVPALERSGAPVVMTSTGPESNTLVALHPAAIMISTLLLRLTANFPVTGAVANVFNPASEIGPKAIEELQKQTVNLLSFQKLPVTVFGAQLAFNMLARPGMSAGKAVTQAERSLRQQLREYLGERVPLPVVRVLQVPVFYSLAISMYMETAQPVEPGELTRALQGERVHVGRSSEPAPSPLTAAGSDEILVDVPQADPDHRAGAWIWASADSLRLAAINAAEIAENLRARFQLRTPYAI
jgi:aspartate-semialdehyde dehydrogenase